MKPARPVWIRFAIGLFAMAQVFSPLTASASHISRHDPPPLQIEESPEAKLMSGELPYELGYEMPENPPDLPGQSYQDPTTWRDEWTGMQKNLGNLMEYILFQSWLEVEYGYRVEFHATSMTTHEGSQAARETLLRLLDKPKSKVGGQVMKHLEQIGWRYECEAFQQWRAKGITARQPVSLEDQFKQDFRMIPIMGQLVAAIEITQGVGKIMDCGLGNAEGWKQLGQGALGMAAFGKSIPKLDVLNPRPGTFLIPGDKALDLSGRIIRTGMTY